MKAQYGTRETPTATEDVLRIAALTAALRVICIANQTRTQQEQYMTVTRPPQREVQIDFTGRVPFGFVFTEGHEATFYVPSGHRFVIEHIDVSCWGKNGHVDVRLVTRSRHMFRTLAVTDWPRHPSFGEEDESPSVAPLQVPGSSASIFLFSNGEVHSSSAVPPDTYVQVWGYLEPSHGGEGS